MLRQVPARLVCGPHLVLNQVLITQPIIAPHHNMRTAPRACFSQSHAHLQPFTTLLVLHYRRKRRVSRTARSTKQTQAFANEQHELPNASPFQCRYCCAACQQADWALHKVHCQALRRVGAEVCTQLGRQAFFHTNFFREVLRVRIIKHRLRI